MKSKQLLKLINEIYEKSIEGVKKTPNVISEKTETDIKEKIRKSLLLYFRLFGVEYFDNQKRDDISQETIIRYINNGIDENIAHGILYALAYILKEPTQEQAQTLNQWAQAYIYTQIAQLGPILSSFEATQFKNKSFILDTEVVLHCLTDSTPYSEQYKNMIHSLLNCGCNVIIPHQIMKEVVKHIESSIKCYYYFKDIFDNIDDVITETMIPNVFVEDYFKQKEKYASFQIYYENIYDPENPIELVKFLLKDLFNNKIKYNDPLLEKREYTFIEPQIIDEFIENIFEETQQTVKGKRRSLEDNRIIAETDAYIYLSISQILEQQKQRNTEKSFNKYLPNLYYFLTSSTRADKCARKMNIKHDVVTNPNILISILSIIGVSNKPMKNYIDLFENPFLAIVANENWSCMKHLVDFGLSLKGANPYTLKRRLNQAINNWLTKQDTESMEEVIDKAKEIGISPKEKALTLYKEMKQDNKQLRKAVEEKDIIINRLIKDRKKEKYLSDLKKKR